MTRGDNVICGTTTTGTGTLTLAACPTPPGGIDFDVLFRAFGWGNSSVHVTSYTIIEYTDATFATAKSHEKGFGTLTLGLSVGISNCTLARTTKQSTATSLNSQPATQNILPGTGITIGTAANTLVFIGPSVTDLPAFSPIYDHAFHTGVSPPATASDTTSCGNDFVNRHYYEVFDWRIPMLVKRAAVMPWTAYGGTSNAYIALYNIGANGRPDRLLVDLGLTGTAGSSLSTPFTAVSTAVHSTGYYLLPGEYYFNFRCTCTGTPGAMAVYANGQPINNGRMGTWAGTPNWGAYTDASGILTPAPDPAYTSGYTYLNGANSALQFYLAPS